MQITVLRTNDGYSTCIWIYCNTLQRNYLMCSSTECWLTNPTYKKKALNITSDVTYLTVSRVSFQVLMTWNTHRSGLRWKQSWRPWSQWSPCQLGNWGSINMASISKVINTRIGSIANIIHWKNTHLNL